MGQQVERTDTRGAEAPISDPDASGHRALERQVRDLAALLTLASAWHTKREAEIVADLPESLARLLQADLVYVRVFGGSPPHEIARPAAHLDSLRQAYAASGRPQSSESIEIAGRRHRLARAESGLIDLGVAIACDRDDFPTDVEAFLLRSALDQAVSAIRTSRLISEVEAADRRKDQFIALLGHELRNPLAPILTALQLMELRGDAATAHERQVIGRQVAHVSRLVDDLLDVSRIVRGKLELEPTTVEIASVIADALEMSAPLFEQKGHVLTTDVPRAGLTVQGDRVRLAQVVSNLLTNAARYTPRGGHVRVAAARNEGCVEIRVKDDGIGIPPELLPSMFELFVQGERSDRGVHGGLGLGLPLVRSLVTLHGGTVSAHSQGHGRGSEFVVRLPAATSDDASKPHASSATAPKRTAGLRVLLVDDNADAAEMLQEMLRHYGFEVDVAHDPHQALALVDEHAFDVAILDLGLPFMDGIELSRRLRERPEFGATRLFALSGWGQEADRERSRAAGFERHFVKPVDVQEVLRALAVRGER